MSSYSLNSPHTTTATGSAVSNSSSVFPKRVNISLFVVGLYVNVDVRFINNIYNRTS